jgi:hypothetical protein
MERIIWSILKMYEYIIFFTRKKRSIVEQKFALPPQGMNKFIPFVK